MQYREYTPKSTIQWAIPEEVGSGNPCYKVDDGKKPDFCTYNMQGKVQHHNLKT